MGKYKNEMMTNPIYGSFSRENIGFSRDLQKGE
jgi:hypothetical protein